MARSLLHVHLLTMLISRLACQRLLLLVAALTSAVVTVSREASAQYYPPPQARPPEQQQSRFELSAFTGWSVNSNPDTVYGELSIGDAQSFGASLGVASGLGASLELKWIYFQPTVQLVGYGIADNSDKFDTDTHYFLIGGTKSIRSGIIEPFFGGSLGAVVYLPHDFSVAGVRYDPDDTWRMAFALGGGLKIFLHSKLALRLGAELLGTVYFYGASFYTGTGGTALGVTGGIPTVTGNFTIGLTFGP
jgi:opacity protein-like surface antigen